MKKIIICLALLMTSIMFYGCDYNTFVITNKTSIEDINRNTSVNLDGSIKEGGISAKILKKNGGKNLKFENVEGAFGVARKAKVYFYFSEIRETYDFDIKVEVKLTKIEKSGESEVLCGDNLDSDNLTSEIRFIYNLMPTLLHSYYTFEEFAMKITDIKINNDGETTVFKYK